MSKPKNSNLKVVNGWGYFPDYRRAVDDQDNSLWPTERTTKFLKNIENTQGPVVWAQEYMNEPIPDHELFTREDFVQCYDVNTIGQEVDFYPKIDEPHYTYAGADLNISKESIADFTAITTIMVREDGRLQIVDGYRGKPGPEGISPVFIERSNRMRWVNVLVENNGMQQFVVHHLGTMRIPVIPFTTGRNKVDVTEGIPYLSTLLKTRQIILPTGSHAAKSFTDILMNESLHYGMGHTGDVLMSAWFCVELIRRLNPAGSNIPLPNPDDMTGDIHVGHQGGSIPDLGSEFGGMSDEFIEDLLVGEGFDTTNLPLFGDY